MQKQAEFSPSTANRDHITENIFPTGYTKFRNQA